MSIRYRLVAATAAFVLAAQPVHSQSPEGVRVRSWDVGPTGPLAADRGVSGVWQRMLKLGTTASLLYTSGHPDDEQAGTLTRLSRGEGVRTALLTLNRGEGGANAIGPELFDALGLIRTEELRLSGRYYGLDDQYYTTAVDYGFSKTYDEALRSWDRDAVIGDMVRIIRRNRPLVVVSRWHGSERDGHGHHQASGILTPEAVRAAADPSRYPEQISAEGLRPWRVRKLYRGGVRPGETRHLEYRSDLFASWLGDTYGAFGAYGLSLQRSQTSGRLRPGRGEPASYERLMPGGSETESDFFDGLDTDLDGVFALTGENPPAGAVIALRRARAAIERAFEAFDMVDPSATAPHLAEARAALGAAIDLTPTGDARWLLEVEADEIAAALVAALGLRLEAVATPAGAGATTPAGPVVAGEAISVHLTLTRNGPLPVTVERLGVSSPEGWGGSELDATPDDPEASVTGLVVELAIPRDAGASRPWFWRPSIADNHYQVRDSAEIHLGETRPRLFGTARVMYQEQGLELSTPVHVLESTAPYGAVRRTLTVLPAYSVSATPSAVIAPPGATSIPVVVEVTSHAREAGGGVLTLSAPAGWSTRPESHSVEVDGRGDARRVEFSVTPAPGATRGRLTAVLASDGGTFSERVTAIEHRDLETTFLFEPATIDVAPVDVVTAPGLSVGYVMGVGDDVPSAIEQLGARVDLLEADALASGDLDAFDAIVIGTRAYAVRPDLVTHNGRLLDYARGGGHLVVLYQTQEFTPETQAPWPASLPRGAEEVSEEDAPVRILAPTHPLLTDPNAITEEDFDGWIEQRGSKFFTSWSDEYMPLVETHDRGQAPQRGVWLSAPVGDGRYSYVALALHRQLPYAVPGAYRILANLISYGR